MTDAAPADPIVTPRPEQVLSVAVEPRKHSTVVRLVGELCVYTAPLLHEALESCQPNDDRELIIIADQLRLLTSHGVDVLEHHADRCHRRSTRLVVCEPSPITERVLGICGLADLIAPATELTWMVR